MLIRFSTPFHLSASLIPSPPYTRYGAQMFDSAAAWILLSSQDLQVMCSLHLVILLWTIYPISDLQHLSKAVVHVLLCHLQTRLGQSAGETSVCLNSRATEASGLFHA